MPRPVTLFTGQWADLPIEKMARKTKEFGYDGIELACWGDHFEVDKALSDDGYCRAKRDLLDSLDLQCHAISAHLVGQAVCDIIDERHKAILPPHVWGDGKPEGVNKRAAEELKNTARAAKKFGISTVNGFTGSSIWHLLYSFPPVSGKMIDDGFKLFAERFHPILDVFAECGVKFALEVHPTEIAFDIYTAERALAALDHRPEFGFNFDPSHLIWQGVDPVEFIRVSRPHLSRAHEGRDRHAQRQERHPGQPHQLWRSAPRLGLPEPGPRRREFRRDHPRLERDQLPGPLSVEWEDSGMDREFGAREAATFVRSKDFAPSGRAFDAAFEKA
jgi:sugar phosphate isomerase/epimerase